MTHLWPPVLLLLGLCAAPADAAPVALKAPAPVIWTADFGDPVLAALLKRADQGCCDLRMAEARLRRAQAEMDLIRAERGLHIGLGGEAVVGGDTFRTAHTGLGVPVAATYEFDLSHRMAHGEDAAKADRTAAEDERSQARLQVSRELVRTYLDLDALMAQRTAQDLRLALAIEEQRLVRRRASEGRGQPGDLAAVSAREAQLRDQLLAADHAIELQKVALSELIGSPDTDLPRMPGVGDATWPPAPARFDSDQVLSRPDVGVAAARLAAADARRAEAVAATRPRFVLTGGLGVGDPNLLYLLDVRALAWSIAGGLSHNLIDGGAGKARIHIADAEADLAELTYRKTVASAWIELRSALVRLEAAAAADRRAAATVATARAALRVGGLRHAEGFVDGVAIIALRDQVAAAEGEAATVHVQAAQAYADLAMALGGHLE